jgi:hypothetical protein
MVVLIVWLQHVTTETKDEFLKKCFQAAPPNAKTMLFKSGIKYDPDYKSRLFLRILNESLANSSQRLVSSLPCLYLYIGDKEVQPAVVSRVSLSCYLLC